MLSRLLKKLFGSFSTGERQDGALVVVECGENLSIRNQTTVGYIDKLNILGMANVVVQCYPDFEAGRSGELLKMYYEKAIELSPFELLQANIANKIETYSKIQNLIEQGYVVLSERHWMYDVAIAVSQGENEKNCIKAYPEFFREMPCSVLLLDVQRGDGEDGGGDDDDDDGQAAFKACMGRLFKEALNKTAAPQADNKYFGCKTKTCRATFEL